MKPKGVPYAAFVKKTIPLTVTVFALTACGGGGGGGSTPESVNVTGSWNGSLQTTGGGGIGAVVVNLTQLSSATSFTGTLSTPTFGGNHPLVGDVAQSTLKTDTSVSGVNEALAFSCTGKFTNASYKGDCTFTKSGAAFVLVMGKQ